MNKLKVLDLFSGIGGFSLGLERTGGFETVAFCEIEDYPRKVLAKHWPNVPIHKDIRELQADAVGHIDLICGGYPCQPFSLAGNRRGKEDDRHLWPEVARLMDAIRPTWGLFENVAGHINMGLDEVLSELEGQGYTAWTLVIPACAVDAPHRRDRVWIVAHTGHGAGRYGFGGSLGRNGERTDDKRFGASTSTTAAGSSSPPEVMAHPDSRRCEEHNTKPKEICGAALRGGISRPGVWLPEPNVGRVAYGVPGRVDRLKGLGNAVVPQIPEMIGRAILKSYES